jgi:natural product biosynthesis luciferase-like monooxygenase protein
VLELFWTLTRGFEVVLHSVAEEAVSTGAPPGGFDAHDVDFSLVYFGSDDGEVADLVGPEKYRLLMEGTRFADENGFSAVWTPERHFHIFGGMFPSPSVAGAALAMITENVQIRSGSVVLPLHDPIQIAEEWQLVDNLSGGRVGMSFASGWQPNDFVFRPENYENRHQVMFDGIETIRDLWRGETRVATGGDGKDVEFITRPRPVQAELPVWVTAGGAVSTFERAGQAGANVLTHLLGQTLDELGEKIRVYREAYRSAGHPGLGTVSLMLHTFVGPDRDAVREVVREPLKGYLKGSVSLFKPFAEALGLDMNNLTVEDEDVLADHAFDRYYDSSGLFGTPDTCVERVHEVKQLGVDEIACLIDFGIGRADVLDHLPYLAQLRDRCAETVAPAIGDYSIPGLIRGHDVSHLQCTPSMATMLLADAPSRRALAKLDVMLVGGEAFPLQVAQQLRQGMPAARIVNMYGPTETTIWSSTWELDDLAQGMTIGTPIANTALYILDRHGRRAAPGGVGELVIGGDGVTRGYHERPELTDERFVPDPFAGNESRMYRTGDLASFRPDGTVSFLGRSDQQVKFRGFRIEMGEIEAAACDHHAVAEAAVVVHGEGEAKRLIAYLVPTPGSVIDVTSVRGHLKGQLTDYMVPTAYVELSELPLTPNKKIDRKALPAPDETNVARTEGEQPSNELEVLISDIWKEVLQLPAVSTSDNFFDLGGHSLLVVHVLNQLRERCDRPVVMTDLFRFPTIGTLAAHIGGESDATAETAAVSQNRAAARKARMGQRRRRRD